MTRTAVPDERPPMSSAPLPGSLKERVSAVLVSRPVTVLTLFLTILGTGVLSYMKIPLTFVPSGLSSSSLSVSMPYPGAGPVEVQDQLTRPVEDTLRTIPGISEITSFSFEGQSQIQVEFSSAVDVDVAYGEVRDRIERIRPSLPDEMDRYRIRRFNLDSLPIQWMGIRYDADDESQLPLIERVFVPRVEGADGVAGVNLNGVVEDVCRIFVDFDRAMGYGVDLGSIIQGLQQDNFTLPAGRIDDGDRTFSLRLDARFDSPEEIERYPIGDGRVLGDIAEVVVGKALRDQVWRINGQTALGLAVSKESGANTIATARAVEEVIDELLADPRFAGVEVDIFWSQKDEILRAIEGLQSSALWGGLFAILVLGFFLRDLRTTLIAALAIPSSLLAALTAVYFSGMTLNLMSLAGFTLGIGMLVDNAVVVIENIARRNGELGDARRAASVGTAEVGLAVLTATLTSIVVFLPLIFMDGDRNTRVIVRELGLPITYSLVASLLVAMVFIPTFAARLMRSGAADQTVELSPRIVGGYRRALGWALNNRFGTLLVLIAAAAVCGGASQNMRTSFSDNGGPDQIRVAVDTPSTYSLAECNEVYLRLEAWADAHMDELDVEFYSTRFSRRDGRLDVYPREDIETAAREQLDDEIRASLAEEVALPGVDLTVGWEGGSAEERKVRVDVRGPDFGALASIAADLKGRFAALRTTDAEGETIPLFDDVVSDIDDGLDEVHVLVDRDRTANLGVSPESIRGMVAWGLGGQRLPDLQLDDGRELPLVIEYAQDDTESLEFVRNLGLWREQTGGMVPLQTVADFRFEKSLSTLMRRNGRSSLGITLTPAVDNVYVVGREVDAVLSDYPLPEGYTFQDEGGRNEFEEDVAALAKVGLLAIVLVYLLMAILLESIALPFCILVSVPLAFLGVFLTLGVTGVPFDVMVVVGMILLAGIVVNNAIVLLDRVQQLRDDGLPRDEALRTGGADRVRPILMTAITTIFGLMPMALPNVFPGSGDSGYQSLAVAVAGGLAFSTLLTLFVVPWAYSLLDDLSVLLRRLAFGAPPRGGAAPRPAPAGRRD